MSDQLQTVLALYEQEISQDQSKRDIDRMIRTRNYQVRNERIETGILVKTQTRKNDSVERKSGECFQWNAKGHCTKGDACSFRHNDKNRGKLTQSSSLAPRSSFLEVVLLERDIKNRADIKGNCTNLSCDFRHLPVCQNYETES